MGGCVELHLAALTDVANAIDRSIAVFTPGAATGRIVRVYAYKLVQMKAGHVGYTVLCGGVMKQRINYSFYQAKCTYKKILLPCFLVT